MADYPPNKIVDMILVLGESQNNYRGAARLYAERYPDKRHPDDMDGRNGRHFEHLL